MSLRSELPMPVRVRSEHVARVHDRLAQRDWLIIETLAALRLATGQQLESLCFADNLSDRSRAVVRGRTLMRLSRWRVIRRLHRRVGGAGGGSSTATFGLDTVGVALARQHELAENLPRRHYGVPGDRFVAHTLAIAQLYADAVALAGQDEHVEVFLTEPACWWPDGLGGHLKPDAYVAVVSATARDHLWTEVDLATESLPTLQRKLLRYLDFVKRGQLGPNGVVPRVVWSVHGEGRLRSLRQLIHELPPPAEDLFVAAADSDAALALLGRRLE